MADPCCTAATSDCGKPACAWTPPEPAEPVIEPWLDDPFPDYNNEPVFAEN